MYVRRPLTSLYSDEEMKSYFTANPLASAEYDPTFIGFDTCYDIVSQTLDPKFTIVDAGCAVGFQSRYFEEFKDYIGIDLPKPDEIAGCPPNKPVWEMWPEKSFGHYLEADATEALEVIAQTYADKDVYVIVSAVPDEKVAETAEILFSNTLTWYPGNAYRARGEAANEIEKIAAIESALQIRGAIPQKAKTVRDAREDGSLHPSRDLHDTSVANMELE